MVQLFILTKIIILDVIIVLKYRNEVYNHFQYSFSLFLSKILPTRWLYRENKRFYTFVRMGRRFSNQTDEFFLNLVKI